jgi:Uma2 family endonuclease
MIKDDVFIEQSPAIEYNDYETERNKPMPSRNHSFIQSRLNFALSKHYLDKYDFFSELNLSPPGVKASVPDLCIYPKTLIDLLEDEIQVTEPPITVIEILSPEQGMNSVKNKFFQIYFPAGVKSVWLVVPTLRSVHIFTPDRKYTTFTSGSLNDPATGITLELDEFFP